MNFARASAYANTAARMRALTRARGVTSLGHALWTEEEDEICRRLYPDYVKLRAALTGRSCYAIQSRCRELKVAKRCPPWTGADIAKLRKLYPTSSWDCLKAAFPHRGPIGIRDRAHALGVYRKKPAYAPTGDSVLDELRAECLRQKISMCDLEIIANGKGYFVNKGWRGARGSINMNRIAKAVRELGGTLTIDWGEER